MENEFSEAQGPQTMLPVAHEEASVVTGQSLDSREKENHDQMSEKCRKNIRNARTVRKLPKRLRRHIIDIVSIFLPVWSVFLSALVFLDQCSYFSSFAQISLWQCLPGLWLGDSFLARETRTEGRILSKTVGQSL